MAAMDRIVSYQGLGVSVSSFLEVQEVLYLVALAPIVSNSGIFVNDQGCNAKLLKVSGDVEARMPCKTVSR